MRVLSVAVTFFIVIADFVPAGIFEAEHFFFSEAAFTALSYTPLFWARNAHLNTVIPNLIRSGTDAQYHRERIDTPDGDFLDLDFLKCDLKPEKEAVLIVHGLEGSSQSGYVKNAALAAADTGIFPVALNMRSCGGELNRGKQLYHSGKTDDVSTAAMYLINSGVERLYLLGFSLGGNIVLKYLGDRGSEVAPEIRGAAAVSVPCHLASSSEILNKFVNRLYLNRFLTRLRAKALKKVGQAQLRDIDLLSIRTAKTLREFDDAFTAPVHGFENADDYYERSSSLYVLDKIAVPALLINAKDDSFLSPQCYPYDQVRGNKNLVLLSPKHGGHVGFIDRFPLSKQQWHERMIAEFFNDVRNATTTV